MALLFSFTLLVSAGLLFLVQPMCARMVLPMLGGTPAVWTTCMLFFQAGLLAGYGYAHLLPARLGFRRHALLHLALLGLAFLVLPISLTGTQGPTGPPVLWLLLTLLVQVGLPYMVVASSAPLLQKWFALATQGRDPYFLYAASNLGSFVALLAYPALVEPAFPLHDQTHLWTWGFVGLVGLTALCALSLRPWHWRDDPAWRAPDLSATDASSQEAAAPSAAQRLHWVLLALVPSSLMLSVTNYLTADIAPIPMLWVIPLGLYLLTFTLVFAQGQWLPRAFLNRWLPLVILTVAMLLLSEATEPLLLILAVHLVGFTWITMVLHGELARTRPSPRHLTGYFLWMSFGGVLGGVFNALIAPALFNGYLEYPLALVAACLLRPALTRSTTAPAPTFTWWDLALPALVGLGALGLVLLGQGFDLDPGPISVVVMFAVPLVAAYTFVDRPLRFGLGIGAVLLASAAYHGVLGPSALRIRSFFGVHRVTELDGARCLIHGNTIHGRQYLEPSRRRQPSSYYFPTGAVGKFFKKLEESGREPRDVAVIGLGTGTLATYGKAGQRWTFFEIDPAVVHLAQDSGLFTFLKDSPATLEPIVVGDARLTLKNSGKKYDLIVLDAFASDSIPLHLINQEAVRIYLDHLNEHGLLLFHVSNRYLDLPPVVANLAAAHEPPLACYVYDDRYPSKEDLKQGRTMSIWMLLARTEADLAPLVRQTLWTKAVPRPEVGVWRDDYYNLLRVLRWRDREE